MSNNQLIALIAAVLYGAHPKRSMSESLDPVLVSAIIKAKVIINAVERHDPF